MKKATRREQAVRLALLLLLAAIGCGTAACRAENGWPRGRDVPAVQKAGVEAEKAQAVSEPETLKQAVSVQRDAAREALLIEAMAENAGARAAAAQPPSAGEAKKIALTFDDGPHPVCTPELLDGLKERGVRATFFVTGEHAERFPDLLRRMKREGHLIGNHTYSHLQLQDGNREAFCQELQKTSAVIERITGQEVNYVRPPYGVWDKALESRLSMIPVLWTIDPLDWCSDSAEAVTRRIVGQARENDIILLHDSYDTSVTAALRTVDLLQEQGFAFVTVEELLLD